MYYIYTFFVVGESGWSLSSLSNEVDAEKRIELSMREWDEANSEVEIYRATHSSPLSI